MTPLVQHRVQSFLAEFDGEAQVVADHGDFALVLLMPDGCGFRTLREVADYADQNNGVGPEGVFLMRIDSRHTVEGETAH